MGPRTNVNQRVKRNNTTTTSLRCGGIDGGRDGEGERTPGHTIHTPSPLCSSTLPFPGMLQQVPGSGNPQIVERKVVASKIGP